MGGRLLSRTTRAVVLTESGSEFLAQIEPILAALEEAEYGVRKENDLRSTLRVSMPASIGAREIIPRMKRFVGLHPNLRVQFILEDRKQDLIRDGIDISIRIGKLADSSATSRMLCQIARVFVASRDYLSKAGTPTSPDELSDHRTIECPASTVPGAWTVTRDQKKATGDVNVHFSVSDNEGAVAAATAGLGIATVNEWSCQRELAEGRLVLLFQEWDIPYIPVHLYSRWDE